MSRCLIVVDYQIDFVSGCLGFPAAEAIDRRIAEKIRAYHAAGDTVLFTLDTHGDHYADTQEGRRLPVPHCLAGTPGHQLYGQTAAARETQDLLFEKPAFGSDALYRHLKDHPYSQIELVGVVTHICVTANAVLAKTAQPETPIIVDASCVASHDPALHRAALAVLAGLQIDVIGNQEEAAV